MAVIKEEKREETGWIKWLSELDKDSGKVAGGKGANLAEMYNSKFPVPPAFVITAQAYEYFIEATEIKEEIKKIIESIDIEDTKQLDESAKKIRDILINKEMPKELKDEIIENYGFLGDSSELRNLSSEAALILKNSRDEVFVAVRSSATTEDLASASFAGQQESFLNVKGRTEIIEAVKRCMASLFTSRAIYYRKKKGFADASIAVVVQKMINSDKSGVIFSRNPVENSPDIVIEAVYGLGEGIVSGKILPDNYIINRDLEIKSKKVADKKIAIVRNSQGENQIVKLTEERSKTQVLEEYEIKKLADYAEKLENHYKKAQDIEFAIENKNIYIVQTRPVTTEAKQQGKEISGEILLRGLGASPGISSGVVKIISDMKDLEKVRKNDILVTKMTNPDMVVAMQKATAIVTDEGGITSHAAIVSREMGIPCVVGTEKATSLLKEGEQISVDGSRGLVYKGATMQQKVEIKPIEKTETEIKVIVDLPDYAERAALSQAKKVGLTRIEGIIAESGKHPMYFVKNKKIKDYEELVYKGVKKISEHFEGMWIRTSDIRSDEFQHLEGARKQAELNPMLGDHGIRFSLKNPEILEAEIKACKRVAAEGKKIGIMIPQLISIEELEKAREIEKNIPGDVEFGVMIETPAAVEIIEEICKLGIDFISFGTNDLTQFTLALDRGNEDVQSLYSEMHPAILSQIERVIKVCKRYKVKTSICGQAASRREMAEFLVKNGIDSLSVNADAAYDISKLVREIENKGDSREEKPEIKEEKAEKKMFNTACSLCGRKTQVPFQPDGVRAVYCKECLKKPKEERERLMREIQEEDKKREEEEHKQEEKEAEKLVEETKTEEKEEGENQVIEAEINDIKLASEEKKQEERKEQDEDKERVLDIF